MRFERSAVETRASRMLWAAALALPMAFGPVAPAAAATLGAPAPPTMPADMTVLAPPGSRISISANLFDNPGWARKSQLRSSPPRTTTTNTRSSTAFFMWRPKAPAS